MGRGAQTAEAGFTAAVGRRRGGVALSRHAQESESAEQLALLTQTQRDVLSLGYSSLFTYTAVIAPEPDPITPEFSEPAIYLVSDLPNSEPGFVTARGNVGSADQMPEGRHFIVSSSALAPPNTNILG